MSQIIRSINTVTKFQILVEVAAKQPDVQQRDIAERLNLSPQAVSDYFRELQQAGWLVSQGRSKYRVTREGVDWMLKGLREWQGYSETVQKAIAGVSICAAVADCDIDEGQAVGLLMRDGLLYATGDLNTQAKGIAVHSARKGEDIGITSIDGIVPLKVGKITVLRLPGIQKGGSRKADLTRLKKEVKGRNTVFTLGIEALVALRKAGMEPASMYGVKEAVIEAARSGLSPAVVCVEEETSDLLARLEEKRVEYEIVDVSKA